MKVIFTKSERKLCRKSNRKGRKREEPGYNALGKLLSISWPEDGQDYIGRITMHHPPSGPRSIAYYKIAYLHHAEREIVNFENSKRKWTFIRPNGISDDYVSKVGYINLEPNGTIKEKALKFVCIFDYRRAPKELATSGGYNRNGKLHYVFWNKEMVFAYVGMTTVSSTALN